MLRYCSVCQKNVEAEGHTHKEKPCQVCGVVKPLAAFPVHASSLDGHKHTCQACYEIQQDKLRQERAQTRQQRIKDTQQRAADNELLRRHHYHWRKVPRLTYHEDFPGGIDEGDTQWQLFDPHNQPIEKDVALATIAARSEEEQERARSRPPQVQSQSYGAFDTMSPQEVARWAQGALARPELRILDTETSGWSWDGGRDDIVELCIVDRAGTVLLNTLVQPPDGARMHPDAAAMTGITDFMLAAASPFSALASQVRALLEGAAVVIFNAEYDQPLLADACERCGQIGPGYAIRCAMRAYHTFSGRRRPADRWVSLADACRAEDIPPSQEHRALADCLSTLALLRRMAERARQPAPATVHGAHRPRGTVH